MLTEPTYSLPMITASRKAGFTLIELLIALIISGILVGVSTETYSLFRKSLSKDQSQAEIAQNGRIVLDRLARELRQTNDVVTVFPASTTDHSVAQPNEIEFQDGNANDLTYRRYYIVNGTLKLDTKQYAFSYDPTHRVVWNAVGTGGVSPTASVISTVDVADHLQDLIFYGDNLLQVQVDTVDSFNQTFTVRTTILGRNTPLGRNP